MRISALATLLVATTISIYAQHPAIGGPPGKLTGQDRWDLYVHKTYMNPLVPLRNGVTAGLAQWMDSPTEWGQGAEGYGRRFGHRLARFAVKSSYEAAGAAILGEDVRYFRRGSGSLMSRVGHAVVSNFVTYDRNGKRVPYIAGIAASVAAEYTAMQWAPERYRTNKRVVRGVAIDFSAGCAIRIVREFSPDLRRLLHR